MMEVGSIADWVSAVAALVAVIGVWIAYEQTKEANLVAKKQLAIEMESAPALKFVVTALTTEPHEGFGAPSMDGLYGYCLQVVNVGNSPAALNIVRSNAKQNVSSRFILINERTSTKIGEVEKLFRNSVIIRPDEVKEVWYGHKSLKHSVTTARNDGKKYLFSLFEELENKHYYFALDADNGDGQGFSLVELSENEVAPSAGTEG
ncbi:hypothetical protein [Lacticaseibacillus hulanensis]|uniref:hypothetical protein n=1 Tax=Lacticaseibacillus hulanensis TaxID=2493111 RepID=UPI000FD9769C|nr:hypothetical protein [Lacticaseibacillus hulanensis]